MKRLWFATIVAATLVVSVGWAPRAQYDYYLTGSDTDVADAVTEFGLGLMGGGTDVDALFTWMSERAGGGDFVVIRASGADGYNQYVFDLGDFDSVETLVLKNRAASSDTFVLETIRNAEALFIAGGDQSDYVNNWKGTPVEEAIHHLIERGVPIAGTSAGTAILSEFIYAAQRQSVTSSQALADPFNHNITLDREFLALPFMNGVITDQHLIERDRLGLYAHVHGTNRRGWLGGGEQGYRYQSRDRCARRGGWQSDDRRERRPSHAVRVFHRGWGTRGGHTGNAADLHEPSGAARGARQHIQSGEVEGHRPHSLHAERQQRRGQLHPAGWIDLLTYVLTCGRA